MVGIVALAFATTATAATLATRTEGEEPLQERERGGPDSARVVRFLDAIAAADPVVCEYVSDPIGNFWFNDREYGVGQLADTRTAAREQKDSLSRRVTDPAAIRVLSARLGTEDPCMRNIAAKMLGNSTVSDDALARLLDNAAARVQEAALRAAGERERLALRGRVERMLGDDSAPVAAMAAWTLGQFDHRGSVPVLRRALTHASPAVRLAAAEALGEIDDQAATADLERVVARDADRRVRHMAIEALGELERLSSANVLSSVLDGDDLELSVAAAEALGELDGLGTAPAALVRALESPHATLRRAAIESVVNFDEDASLAPKLLPHITDADPEVRVMVIEALGDMGARAAIPALKRALGDSNAEVRRAAIEALAELEER